MIAKNDNGLKSFLSESKYNVELLSRSEGTHSKVEKEEFDAKMLQLKELSLMESKIKMKGGSQEVVTLPKKHVYGLMPEDSDQSSEDYYDWKPHLRKTEAVGSAQGGNFKPFEWPDKSDL